MARDSCKMLGCEREPGTDTDSTKFCSTKCEVKYDHLKDDARDARAADREQARRDGVDRRDRPEMDGPPY